MIINEDIDIVAEDIKNKGIRNSKIVITGATGLLGALLAKGFVQANRTYNLNNKVYALVRNPQKAEIVFDDYKDENFIIVKNNIIEPIEIEEDVDYIFHAAAITKSKEMVSNPTGLIKTTVQGTTNVLDFANEHNAKSVVFLSSMEVYGVVERGEATLKEKDLGWLDLSNIRNCYPESKRLAENMCVCYSDEYGLNVKVARLTQTFGAGANYDETRIFGMIARNILEKKDIVLHTMGGSTRDYCYTTDAINAILTIAVSGEIGEIYNVANPKTNMSIKEMAELVANEFGGGDVKVVLDIPQDGINCYGSDSFIRLNVDKLLNLGWQPRYGLKEMYSRLVESFEEQIKYNKKL